MKVSVGRDGERWRLRSEACLEMAGDTTCHDAWPLSTPPADIQETLTKHKPMVATYLDQNYDRFFAMYNVLIMSNNYVTKRQSLKLLGEILLDRANYSIMTRYIASEANLKLMMNFLRDRSRNIQFEAFHVFKVGADGYREADTAGVCGKPEQATGDCAHPQAEQGASARLPQGLSQRQGG